MRNSAWNAWFHFQECAFVGTQLLDSTQLQKSGSLISFSYPKTFFSPRTLLSPRIHRLMAEDTDAMDLQVIKELDRIVHVNQYLQELNVVVQEVNIFSQGERFIQTWHNHSSRLRLTLLEPPRIVEAVSWP
jgi:hypothetical protein